ncbi:hypothetical protein [Shouchella lonarensis]|uniref:Uncharacterized protein n=1 Tax=Shouchella lonarensis TaxID=1464122 RepID=A0A1G6GYL2_9BACI|nr:hypothetical protein [Shouchella lonarensis]SDB87034.1 hypothetical protein SAMN05421737_102160 [Shouchella lonarensis]
MIEEKQVFSLSTEELSVSMMLCGYEQAAADALKNTREWESDEQLQDIVGEAELSLRRRGYQNEQGELVHGLESLVHLLMRSEKKVRCLHDKKVMILHDMGSRKALVQKCEDGMHHFDHIDLTSNKQGEKIVQGFYQFPSEEPIEMEPFMMSSEMFQDFSVAKTEKQIDDLLSEGEHPPAMQSFMKDFVASGCFLDNMSLIKSDIITDENQMPEIHLFLPSKSFIWYIDYTEVDTQGKVYFYPTNSAGLIEMIMTRMSMWFGH